MGQLAAENDAAASSILREIRVKDAIPRAWT